MNSIESAIGGKLGIDAIKKLPGKGFERRWPPLVKMDATIKENVVELLIQGTPRP